VTSLEIDTEQAVERSGWMMLRVLGVKQTLLSVVIEDGEVTTVNTLRMSQYRVVISLSYFSAPLCASVRPSLHSQPLIAECTPHKSGNYPRIVYVGKKDEVLTYLRAFLPFFPSISFLAPTRNNKGPERALYMY